MQLELDLRNPLACFQPGCEVVYGRWIGVVVFLHQDSDPWLCWARIVPLRWKNPEIIGKRHYHRDYWNGEITYLDGCKPATPSHQPQNYSLIGSGLWKSHHLPLPSESSMKPVLSRKIRRSTKHG